MHENIIYVHYSISIKKAITEYIQTDLLICRTILGVLKFLEKFFLKYEISENEIPQVYKCRYQFSVLFDRIKVP